MDHIRLRIPEESDGDATTLVRSSVTTADHPVGVTGPTDEEVAPTTVIQFSDVRTPTAVADKAVAESTEFRRCTRVRKPLLEIEYAIRGLRIMLQFS
ncbi:hypothetical protein LSAT2_002953 [Lamellibrachia satsuma]|nr:hypothetical protein LSAT2_002953 [Lamellibrachia satsuma]